MRPFGFSTGAIALADFHRAVDTLRKSSATAMELSALREAELQPLMEDIPLFDIGKFSYIAIHAPSVFRTLSESQAARLLATAIERQFPIVVHPDAIREPAIWRNFGGLLLIENMDKRKPIGRTSEELSEIFAELPDAGLCFDIGHAYQVDPTMCVAAEIARDHRSRIRHLHVSEVDTASRHRPLSLASFLAYRKIVNEIDTDIPVILESVLPIDGVEHEISKARRLFDHAYAMAISD